MAGRWLGVVVLVLVAGSAAADTRDAIELQMHAEVAAVSPEAAQLFDDGTAARDAGRFDDAVAAFEKAIALAPNVDHLHRRLCTTYEAKGDFDQAMKHCERAVELARGSPYNMAGVIGVMLSRNGPGDQHRALLASDLHLQAHPKHPAALRIRCHVLLGADTAQDNAAKVRDCIARWLAADPEDAAANLYGALAASEEGDYDVARGRLEKAKAAGLDAETYARVGAKIAEVEEATATFPRWAHAAFWIALAIIGGWLAVMGAIFLVGIVLSRRTLATVNATATSPATLSDGTGTAKEQRLRRIYRSVLLFAGAYFYLSIPILLGMIIACGVGALLVFWAMGVIPIKLAFLIVIIVGYTIVAIVRSMFVRVQSRDPGLRIDLRHHAALRATLDEVAAAVGTRAVDTTYLVPGAELAVTERGGLWSSIRQKRTERCLILGVGLFDGMTLAQFRSVLAHEYGHFRNGDTAGGGFAIAVQRSLYALIIQLAVSGVAAGNPVWWFARGFARMYAAVSRGASRLQEVLADRWAIQAYGTAAFVAGYKHVVARSVHLDFAFDDSLRDVIENEKPLVNLYTYEPAKHASTPDERAQALEAAMSREPTIHDSHPASQQRIAWAAQLAVVRAPRSDDDAPVWSLFDDRAQLEEAMTDLVRSELREQRGVEIAKAAA